MPKNEEVRDERKVKISNKWIDRYGRKKQMTNRLKGKKFMEGISMMEIKEDVRDMSIDFQGKWVELRRNYGKNIVLADLYTAAKLKDERWEAQSAPDKAERAEATKDVMRCDFTFKVFNALKKLKSVSEVQKNVSFAEYYYNHIEAFGQLMGDVPKTLKRQGEWWLTELRRIPLGGKVSGETLTLLSLAAARCLKQKFDEARICYPLISFRGETERAKEIIESLIDKPFFNKASADESDRLPFDIKTWVKGFGEIIELFFDDDAIEELTESLAWLSDGNIENKNAMVMWVRACGTAVKETAEGLPDDWIRKNHDECFVGLPRKILDIKMRNSIAGVLVGARLLGKTLSDFRDLSFYSAFGILLDDYEEWLIETQRKDKQQ